MKTILKKDVIDIIKNIFTLEIPKTFKVRRSLLSLISIINFILVIKIIKGNSCNNILGI